MAVKETKLISKFRGINRREYAQDGEFINALNVSADEYPYLKTVKGMKRFAMTDTDGNEISNIRAVIFCGGEYDGSFTGVAGTDFYYKGKKINPYVDARIPETGDIQLLDYNGNIIVCCYNSFEDRTLLYYNYHNYAPYDERYSKGYLIRMDCARFMSSDLASLKFLPAAASSGAKYYIVCGDSPLYFSNFKVGDSIVWNNLISENNAADNTEYKYARETLIRQSRYEEASDTDEVVCLVTGITLKDTGSTSSMTYCAYNARGELVTPKKYIAFSYNNGESYTSHSHEGAVVRKAMPIINSLCIHNNRLWAVNPNGEYIYASKLGGFKEFNSFNGISSDSYYVGVGTGGGFTGIVTYKNYVLAFKENCVHIVTGTMPSNFSVSRSIDGIGCRDIRSCAVCGGKLYFLSSEGFCRFDGVSFENISKKLNKNYKKAIGFGFNKKYYVYAEDENDKGEFLVFDEKYGAWFENSVPEKIVGFFAADNRVYAACPSALYLLEELPNTGWCIETNEIYEEDCSNSFVNELWIRAKIDTGKNIGVYTCGDGEYSEHMSCVGTGEMKIYRIPVRWQNAKRHKIKLKGNGNAVLYDIVLKEAEGGRQYKI